MKNLILTNSGGVMLTYEFWNEDISHESPNLSYTWRASWAALRGWLCGGPDGAVVFYSVRGHGNPSIIELLDKDYTVIGSLSFEDAANL